MPRVVSGTAKGCVIKSTKGILTRPTADRVKEAVFNILADHIEGSVFLDLFAGSGQMGIEALSRGAARAVFVDRSAECVSCIKNNLEKTRLTEKAEIIRGDFIGVLSRLHTDDKFNLVYVDPPYKDSFDYFSKIVRILADRKLIRGDAVILLEHSSNVKPDDFVINMQLKRSCKYGSTMISFYEGLSAKEGIGGI